MLEELENTCTDICLVDVEQVQAWILVAIYEFLRSNYCHGWKSAGRSFRLVQLMRLYTIDSPNSIHNQGDWIITEEMRRTFWMAYSLDLFASVTNDWWVNLLFSCFLFMIHVYQHALRSEKYYGFFL
jgi:hypothetical protein